MMVLIYKHYLLLVVYNIHFWHFVFVLALILLVVQSVNATATTIFKTLLLWIV